MIRIVETFTNTFSQGIGIISFSDVCKAEVPMIRGDEDVSPATAGACVSSLTYRSVVL
jgi:hypothetical protein